MSLRDTLNEAARKLRDVKFEFSKALDGHDSPIIVSEGDSWFQHPIETDIIDALSCLTCGYKIRSLGAAGDQLSEMLQHLEFPEAIKKEDPEAFLFSGGGNDIVDEGLSRILRDSKNITTASECIKEKELREEIDQLAEFYRSIYSKAQEAKDGIPMIVHGYAHPRPGKRYLGVLQWGLTDMLKEKNVRRTLWRRVASLVLDGFNRMLERLEEELPHLHYVDLRPLISRSDFIDELHLKSRAAGRAAEEFDEVIQEAIGRSHDADGFWS